MSAAVQASSQAAAAGSGRAAALSVLGVPFHRLTLAQAIDAVRTMIADGTNHYLVLANANVLNLAYEDPRYRAAVAGADLVLRDGVGVEIACRLHGVRLEDNFVGTDFVPSLLSALEGNGIRVFLYGAAPGVAEAAADVLAKRLPGLSIAGVLDGYGNHEAAVERIAAAGPDLLLVALGNPLQEAFIANHLERLNARVSIGVGALFDFLADRVPRAPRWVRAIRCEWLFRLAIEPRRMWRRYVVGNPKFLWRVLASRLGERRGA